MPAERRGAISFGNATNKTMAFNHTSAPTTSLFGSAVPASAPAPAPVAFGTTAPTTGGFQLTASGPHPTSNLFGTSTTPTAAPVPGAFGSTAPAFSATASAPAPPAFGFTAPAPTTSLFGASTPAPPAFGATAAFGGNFTSCLFLSSFFQQKSSLTFFYTAFSVIFCNRLNNLQQLKLRPLLISPYPKILLGSCLTHLFNLIRKILSMPYMMQL